MKIQFIYPVIFVEFKETEIHISMIGVLTSFEELGNEHFVCRHYTPQYMYYYDALYKAPLTFILRKLFSGELYA